MAWTAPRLFLFRFGCPLEHGMWRLKLPESHGIPVTHVPSLFSPLVTALSWHRVRLSGISGRAGGVAKWALTGTWSCSSESLVSMKEKSCLSQCLAYTSHI